MKYDISKFKWPFTQYRYLNKEGNKARGLRRTLKHFRNKVRQTADVYYHSCVPVDIAIKLLKEQGKNYLNVSPEEALQVLLKQQKLGKEYLSGCDNETSEGLCAGHLLAY